MRVVIGKLTDLFHKRIRQMTNKLDKPYSLKDRAFFILQNKDKQIVETETALYAIEVFEKIVDDNVVDNSEQYIYELEQAEKDRIAHLSLTKREVFLALYNAKNLKPEDIRSQIADEKALIEFDYATEYYRGNPLIDTIGAMLGFSSDDLDYLFEHKEFRECV